MSDEPMSTIYEFLVEKQGVPGVKVTPSARILHDLGVDGDDAGDLFEALHARFGTDFTELTRQWDVFFGAEGASPRVMLLGIPVIVVCGGAAGALTGALHWHKIVGFALTLALLVGCGWMFSRWFGREVHPLTVGGLSDIVHAGRWPADPADVR